MGQEKWINEVLESTKGMQKAEPSPFLFEQITSKIKLGKQPVQINSTIKWGLAVSMSVIIILNVISVFKSNSSTQQANVETQVSTETSLNNATTYTY